MTNGYIASAAEFSGAVNLFVNLAMLGGDDLFLFLPQFSSARDAWEGVLNFIEGRPVDTARATACFDYLSQELFSRVDTAQRESRNATDWVIKCCEVLALAQVLWNIARNNIQGADLTPERVSTITFVQELEADLGAYFQLFHGSNKLWHSPELMSWVWELYRSRSRDDWASLVQQDRFVLPDDLIPVIQETDAQNGSSAWPPHWMNFSPDFAQSLCFLRGGHGELVRFYTSGGEAKCDMNREAARLLHSRLKRLLAGREGQQSAEWRRAAIRELDLIGTEFPWSFFCAARTRRSEG